MKWNQTEENLADPKPTREILASEEIKFQAKQGHDKSILLGCGGGDTLHSIVENGWNPVKTRSQRRLEGHSWSSSQEMVMKAEAAWYQEDTSGRKNND